MTKFTIKSTVLALAAITAASFASVANAQDANSQRDIRDFRIVNNSNAVIQGAWVAVARPNTPWVKIDLSSPIGPNGAREIAMAGWRGSQCTFDVKVAFDDGTVGRWTNVNLCRVTNLSI